MGVRDLVDVDTVDSGVTEDSEEGVETDVDISTVGECASYNDSVSGLIMEERMEILETLEGVLVIVVCEELTRVGVARGVVGPSRTLDSEGSTESEGRRKEVSKEVSTPSWTAIECNDGEGNKRDDS